jgi:hypothetical protein
VKASEKLKVFIKIYRSFISFKYFTLIIPSVYLLVKTLAFFVKTWRKTTYANFIFRENFYKNAKKKTFGSILVMTNTFRLLLAIFFKGVSTKTTQWLNSVSALFPSSLLFGPYQVQTSLCSHLTAEILSVPLSRLGGEGEGADRKQETGTQVSARQAYSAHGHAEPEFPVVDLAT